MQASGHHKVLDFLSLSLSLPLYYHPHSLLSQKFTKSVKDLLPYRDEMRSILHQHSNKKTEEMAAKEAMRKILREQFVWDQRYKSDFG